MASGVTLVSATQLRATTPAGTAGAQAVQVTNATGASATMSGAFTYATATLTLTSVSPASGPTAGGTTITLTGSGFVSGATVRVGGNSATSVTFVGSTQLTARTPAGTAGARDVQITNPNGQSATRTGGFTYATAAAPTLTSVSPTSGPAAGGTTITVTGANFVSGATVRVGGASATNVAFVSATQLTARTPAGTAGARDVQVTNPDGQSATRDGRLHLYGTGDGADADVGGARRPGPPPAAHHHRDRHELRVRRDGARRRHLGDERRLRQRDAADGADAGGHGGRARRAGHEPGRAVGDAHRRASPTRRRRARRR